jgi:Bacteriophage head to tail connecting protein
MADLEYTPKAPAAEQWMELDAARSGRLALTEHLSKLTLTKVCPSKGQFPISQRPSRSDSAGYDSMGFDSTGAIGVKNLGSRLVTALFRPSVPFFRVLPGAKTKGGLAQAGMSEEDLGPILSKMERDGARALDMTGQRPKLYSCMEHLIVAGNALLYFDKDSIRMIGMRDYVIRRDYLGRVHTLIVRQMVQAMELDPEMVEYCGHRIDAKTTVSWYTRVWRNPNGSYSSDQWLDNKKLPDNFTATWSELACPYKPQVWDLADEDDWGTGLVEEYEGSLMALHLLGKATVTGALLASEFRMLVAGGSSTDLRALRDSQSGWVIPGRKEDVTILAGGNHESLRVAQSMLEEYRQQVSRGFLLQSGTVRNAERVTAREIDLDNQELSARFGGLYPTLGSNLQPPVAHWCLQHAGHKLKGTDLKVQIMSGLDALSRSQDLTNLRGALNDMALVSTLPPALQARLKIDRISTTIGSGWGLDFEPYLLSDQQVQAAQQAESQQRINEGVATNPAFQQQGSTT